MKLNELESIAIIGLGLMGGSVGLAVSRAFSGVERRGYSHRPGTRQKALRAGTVDSCCASLAELVASAQLVIIASPIGTFELVMEEMADHLAPGCVVTDVGSTKVLPARWAKKHLPSHVAFLGSHPIAGSEQRGVEFSRADLLDNANCIVTPTAGNTATTIRFVSRFWEKLGMQVTRLSPAEHDRILARISHLPHVLATALVNSSVVEQTHLCGKGFLDTTRIASGPPSVWKDILTSNAANTDRAIGKLIKELTRMQSALRQGNERAIAAMLTEARIKRNQLVAEKLRRKELPA